MNDTFIAKYIDEDFPIEDFNHENWTKAERVEIKKYWSGEDAPNAKHAKVCALWSDDFLYVRFDCNQEEPLIVSERPQTESKTPGVWDRDVCEIFIASNSDNPNHYFEFEAAPTGEWIDLEIYFSAKERETNWKYKSEMKTFSKVEESKVTTIIKIPFSSLNSKPKAGESWRVNLFRCVGLGDTRYLAWQPTQTEKPNFHVPEKFGWLYFQG